MTVVSQHGPTIVLVQPNPYVAGTQVCTFVSIEQMVEYCLDQNPNLLHVVKDKIIPKLEEEMRLAKESEQEDNEELDYDDYDDEELRLYGHPSQY